MREDLHTEFKREWKTEYLRNVAALANTDGGIIHIGISDDGSVFGVRNLKADLKRIPDDIQNALDIVPIVDHYIRDGKECISITVRKSPDSVFYGGKLWVKSGSTTRALSGSELRERLLKDANMSWTDTVAEDVQIDDLSSEALLYFLKASKKPLPDSDVLSRSDKELILSNLGLLISETKISKTAVLLFHESPWKHINDAYLKIGMFDDRKELLREEYVKCPLIMMPDKVSDLLFDKFIPGHYDYSEMRRKMVYLYPPEAIREIVTNAIVHEDYSVGLPVEIRVYPDRLTVFNFGELPSGWTVENLLEEHPSIPRNRHLAEVFHEAGFIEKWGKGIGSVLESCAAAGLSAPTFEVRFKGLSVTFDSARSNYNDVSEPVLSEVQIAVIEAIHRGCRTRKEIASETGLSFATVKRALTELIDLGRIEREGSNKSGSWVILEK